MPGVPDDNRGVRWADGLAFAIIPEWVLDAPDITHAGVRLFAILARYANDSGESFPGRKALAERMRCSLSTLDRALDDLEAAGAIEVVRRVRDDGGQTSNLYVLQQRSPRSSQVESPPVVVGDDPRTKATSSNEKTLTPPVPPSAEIAVATRTDRPAKVDRRNVTDGEYEIALAALAEFNRIEGRNFTGKGWVSKVVMRVREHPELDADHHREIVRRTLAGRRWWKGPPDPAVIYGNDTLFDRNLNAAASPPDPDEPLTVEQARAWAARYDGPNVIEADAVEELDA